MRSAEIHRKTKETETLLRLELDGTGTYQIDIESFRTHAVLVGYAQSDQCQGMGPGRYRGGLSPYGG